MEAPSEPRAVQAVQAVVAEAGEAERVFNETAVTQEEIERLTVAEGLSDLERAQLYISGGQAVQEMAVIHNLPGLVRAAGRGAWTAISRGLAEVARGLDPEGQAAAAAAFATLARERLLPAVDITDVILPLALGGVGEGGAPAGGAQAAWLACLAEVCAAVEPGTLHSRVLPLVAARCGGAGRTPRERCLGCELLGAVAPHVAPEDLQRTLLRLAATLCGDTEWQVRHAACQQLPALAAAAAAKLEAPQLAAVLEDIYALLEDEEALVRAAAWRALTATLELLPHEARRGRVLPLLLSLCKELDHHAEVQRALAAGLGALLCRLVPDMDGDAEVNACLAGYRQLAWRHDHAVRLACAAAFPAVLRAGTARRYGSHLHDTLQRLASDGDVDVRLAVAGCLAEVAALLGRDRCCQYLRQPVAALLQDERQEVQAALLARLPEVLQQFAGGPPAGGPAAAAVPPRPPPAGSAAAAALAAATAAAEEQRGKTFAPFVEPLLRLEAVSGYSWRLQAALLQAMAAFPAFFTPDQLHDRFLPLALKHMGEGAAAVRPVAARAAAAIWRALRRPAARTALYSRLIHDFAQSKCFRHRIVFIDFCGAAQQLFSSKFVKLHLLGPALSLAYDPVANVRLHLAAAMPSLKTAVALPDDVHLLERLNSGMSHLITDGDADVCQAARKANEEFKRLPVRMSCGALESSPAEVKAFEAADAALAESEREYLFDSDALDKIRADIAAYDEGLRPANSRLALALPAMRGGGSGAGGASSRADSGRTGVRTPAPPVGAVARARAIVGAAGAGGHQRSASDTPEMRRDKVAATSTRAASAGTVGSTSPGSKAAGVGSTAVRAAARTKTTAAAAGQSPSGAGRGSGPDDAPPSGHGAPAAHRQPMAGHASRMGAASTSKPETAAPASRLSRPSPSAAAASKRSPLASPAEQSAPVSPHAPAAANPALQQPERPPPAAAAAGGGHGTSAVPHGLKSAAADVGQLESKLKAALHMSAAGSAARSAPRRSAEHGLSHGSSSFGKGLKPVRSSMQHAAR